MIRKEKVEELKRKMGELGIKEDDLLEKFILGSGSGGQKINKTSSCVYLKHIPSGEEVKCQKDRSREMNRYYARKEIYERLRKKIENVLSEKEQAQEKIRRQKRRRSRKSKNKMLEEKKAHSETKAMRRTPADD